MRCSLCRGLMSQEGAGAGIALNPDSAQAWYNLGLAEHAGNEVEPALASFQNAVKLDPRDADSIYFEAFATRR